MSQQQQQQQQQQKAKRTQALTWEQYVAFDEASKASLLHTNAKAGGDAFQVMYDVLEEAHYNGVDLVDYFWKRDGSNRTPNDYLFYNEAFYCLDNTTRILGAPMPSVYDDVLTPAYVEHRQQEERFVKGYVEGYVVEPPHREEKPLPEKKRARFMEPEVAEAKEEEEEEVETEDEDELDRKHTEAFGRRMCAWMSSFGCFKFPYCMFFSVNRN